MECGIFSVASLHGDLKQLFVMIQTSRVVGIPRVVWKFYICKDKVLVNLLLPWIIAANLYMPNGQGAYSLIITCLNLDNLMLCG